MYNPNQKGIVSSLAIIIVIVVGVLAIGGVLVYQYWWAPEKEAEVETPKIEVPKDETADWKIYRNEKYGFEVKYPKAYSQKVDNDETGLLIVRFENIEGISYYVIHITEKIRSPKLSNFFSNPECYDPIETKKQNNIDWSINRWKCGFGAEQNPIAAYAAKQNYVFEIQLDSNSETSSLERINQMLSTFRFIEY